MNDLLIWLGGLAAGWVLSQTSKARPKPSGHPPLGPALTRDPRSEVGHDMARKINLAFNDLPQEEFHRVTAFTYWWAQEVRRDLALSLETNLEAWPDIVREGGLDPASPVMSLTSTFIDRLRGVFQRTRERSEHEQAAVLSDVGKQI